MPDNLLFIFADQMRGQDMGCAGNTQVRTPELDRLAADGVQFTNAVSTCPVCTPYRASLLTGRYPLSVGMTTNDVRLSVRETSIAHVMRDAGYDTGYIGKWHLDGPYRGGFTPPGPRRQGFDYWAAADCTHDYLHSYYYRDEPEPIWIEGYDADHFTDLTLDFMRARRDRPFCLFLSWGPPHNPYELLPEEYKQYDPREIVLRGNVPAADAELARQRYAGYYDHITALDRNVGRLRQGLRDLGIEENTLLVFTSDHGDMLRSHGWDEKQLPYEESIYVPFLAAQPGRLPAGQVSDAPLNVPDLMPTLLSQLGLPCPATVEGADLSFALRGAPGAGPSSAFCSNPTPFVPNIPEWRAVRTRTHTYARSLEGPWLLFDNVNDPFQLDNLVGRPEARELQAELDAEVTTWMERTGDEGLTRPEYVERFGYNIAPALHPVHYLEVGRHDPEP